MGPYVKDRVALIAGGSRGIGRAAAFALARAGAKVVICGRDPQAVENTTAALRDSGAADVHGIASDCSHKADVAAMVASVVKQFGRIDVLLNSLQGPRAVPFVESSDEDWLEAFNTKLMGQVRCAREVFPHMVRQHWGRIINIGGTHGQLPSAYAMSAGMINAALANFTRALAELGAPHNVLANLLSPGPIQTERTSYLIKAKAEARNISEEEAAHQHRSCTLLNRIGTVEEVTPLILLLASEQASYMTGAVYSVDGGQYRAE
jgi:3-oxoacyl-[acyl-carrier protein] reductase/bacilysin biosynthesis oxidoreductase BacG